ncbi:hypothetical protein M4S82_11905 [Planococcus sp. MERTA32b]|nr:hypothetical protein [Planococcus sp. MER TA 32b]
MNWAVLKDGRTMLGLVLSVLLSVGAIVLAVYDNGYWVVLSVIAMIVLSTSIAKADKVTKQG